MLASMSQTEWSDVGMSDLLPTGMVTLLLADIEGSTQPWETQPDEMAAWRPTIRSGGSMPCSRRPTRSSIPVIGRALRRWQL